ncbi:Hypothetical protein R9X50_00469600 [Acrodontium crateriforme]|uniref:Rhamnogalacturonase A/B/Epimerase-like pectate lyase domain-containing protein n=1 Tax=Acrodontium crateriforme TaxID=150365 RepID=A0AAQ3M4R2_9PEZI|nr:Hypothetical protein R9X50_00469600 [Acrodontium crateriforme]
MSFLRCIAWFLTVNPTAAVQFTNPVGFVGSHAPLPKGTPGLFPEYMRDNVNNEYGTAPDHGLFDGPLLGPISDFDASRIKIEGSNGLEVLSDIIHTRNMTNGSNARSTTVARDTGSYWLESLGSKGIMPLAGSDFEFFRNVKDYGAVGDGSTDDTVAINKAASDGPVCGSDCGSTTVHGTVVYFPPGTYLVSSPIVQYYHQQFIGDPVSPPTLKSSTYFTGIAVVDSDVYIPGGSGQEWYINQNNFYRSIQNINFDLSGQATRNFQNGQIYTPTGIHWQPAQGTSITNCAFTMSGSTAVGILMENGSGGFMSDLEFTGGNAGMVVGSQQFTFRNMSFKQCMQAISVIWNWGMSFQNIYVESCPIAFNCTAHGGPTNQGAGSLSIIDSHFNGVKQAITVASSGVITNIVLENVRIESTDVVVQDDSGKTIFPGTEGDISVTTWALGGAYLNQTGEREHLSGYTNPTTTRPSVLLDSNGRYLTQSKPLSLSMTPVVATDHGVKNDMTGDQTSAINSLLASNIGNVIFFPAGIYLVQGTVFIPEGSKIIGSGFSQIMATGPYFGDKDKPNVMVRVGNPGESGVVEIQDFLFTVQGPTAGCILVEWNIAQSSPGSAAMWNSNFRVGGAAGSDLQVAQCQGATADNEKCQAASLMLHLTPGSSAYLENVWAWVADHDLDNPDNAKTTESRSGAPINANTNVNIYAGRGILIESKGPTWFWATASEHSELYNYQLANAGDIILSHMQTESPYYQPEKGIDAFAYQPGSGSFVQDPTFDECSDSNCYSAWALRILNSSQIGIYTSGFYSFFNQHVLGCGSQQDCQEHLIETNYVGDLFYYNILTYGAVEIVSPAGGIFPPIFFNDSNQDGYTSEVAAYLELADSSAASLGIGLNASDGGRVVYIDPAVWVEPQASRTVGCIPPCTLVLPPITLSAPTTISIPPWTTTIEVGWTTTTAITTSGVTITSSFFTSITETTVITIPPVTTTEIPIWNVVIPSGGSGPVAGPTTTTTTTPAAILIFPTSSITPPPIVITDNPNPLNQTGVTHPLVTRTIYPPPWPWVTTTSSHDTNLPSITWQSSKPKPTCHSGCGTECKYWCRGCNPLPLICKLTGNCCTGSDFCTTICPPGTGSGNDGNIPPNDPNNDDDDDNCSTVTASDCTTQCIGTSCSATCRTFEGCKTTGSDLATTETPADYWIGNLENWITESHDAAYSISVAASVESELIASSVVFTTGTVLTAYPTQGLSPPSGRMTTTSSISSSTPTITQPPNHGPSSTATLYVGNYPTLTGDQGDLVYTYFYGFYEGAFTNAYCGDIVTNTVSGGYSHLSSPIPYPATVRAPHPVFTYTGCIYEDGNAPEAGFGGLFTCDSGEVQYACNIANHSSPYNCESGGPGFPGESGGSDLDLWPLAYCVIPP